MTVSSSDTRPLLAAAPEFRLPDDWQTQHPVLSPNAKPEVHWTELAARAMTGHPGDGGGRIWLESVAPVDAEEADSAWQRGASEAARPALVSSSSHRFTLRFEAGPRGVPVGGVLFLLPETSWFWSAPQTSNPAAAGFTTARSLAEGVDVGPDDEAGAFTVTGRDLAPGEQVEFVYGAGPGGARVDRYAERGAEILLGVDADGDGFRKWLPKGVWIDVLARPAQALVAFGPAEIAPGDDFEIQVALVDRFGNRADWPTASASDPASVPLVFQITTLDASALSLQDGQQRVEVALDPGEPVRIPLSPTAGEGTLRLRLEGRGALEGLRFDLPPIVARKSETRLVWGDLHGHSQLSDGTGTAEDYFRYARDVARLDVVALTDHDHWGPRPLDQQPEVVTAMNATTRAWNESGRFVTIPGYEWTSWLHGHRHVLHFGPEAPLYSSLDAATDRPDELWAALRGTPSLTFAHHSAGEPIATNWFYPPDPELEPLTEIASVHGMSEAADAPVPILGAIPGNFARDALLHGVRLGFIGSGDSHDGHPGLAQIASGQAGLAGLFTRALDRDSLLDAMRHRHTFATNGIRPWLEVTIDEVPMGGTLGGERGSTNEDSPDTHTLRVHYEATAPIERVDLIRSSRRASLEPDADAPLSFRLTRAIPRLAAGEFHYVRILQTDGGTAWSSPIFVVE